jgi:tetratricopeptide (TPR) repeat protein
VTSIGNSGPDQIGSVIEVYLDVARRALQQKRYQLCGKMLVAALRQARSCHSGEKYLGFVCQAIAHFHTQQGRHHQAIRFFNYAIKSYEKILGKNHIQTAPIFCQMADEYANRANFKRASRMYRTAINIFRSYPDQQRELAILAEAKLSFIRELQRHTPLNRQN